MAGPTDCNDKNVTEPHSGIGGAIADFVSNHFGSKPETKACEAPKPELHTAKDVAQNMIDNKGLGLQANADIISNAFQHSGETPENFAKQVNQELAANHSDLRLNAKTIVGGEAEHYEPREIRFSNEDLHDIFGKPRDKTPPQVASLDYEIGKPFFDDRDGQPTDKMNPNYQRVFISIEHQRQHQ